MRLQIGQGLPRPLLNKRRDLPAGSAPPDWRKVEALTPRERSLAADATAAGGFLLGAISAGPQLIAGRDDHRQTGGGLRLLLVLGATLAESPVTSSLQHIGRITLYRGKLISA